MEFSFENDEFVGRMIRRMGKDSAQEIFRELQKRYDECDSAKRHLGDGRNKSICGRCYRTLSPQVRFKHDLELLAINDWYAGLIGIERERRASLKKK